MTQSKHAAEPSARTLADLSALADGTLEGDRADAVRELIDRSPDLRQRYGQERQAVTALHALRADRAPARLRLAVDRRRQPVAARPRRVIFGGALAAVAAAIAAAILLLPGSAPGSPSVSQAAALALRGPAMGPPPPDTTQNPGKLKEDVEEVYFPDWSGWSGWRPVGQRIDRIGGRRAVTVYYRHGDRQIAYTILASPAVRWPAGQTRWLYGTMLRSFGSGGRLIVTWRRANHTCILSARGVSAGEMSRLAAWKGPGLSS